jgi:hypothetical protein
MLIVTTFRNIPLLHVTFPVIIGFDDLFPFQNFGDFPSCVLGDFKLYIRVSPDVLVWCSVNPVESIRQMAEVYPFTENNDHEIFNYKQFANVISSARQQNNMIIDLHKSTHLDVLLLIVFLTFIRLIQLLQMPVMKE